MFRRFFLPLYLLGSIGTLTVAMCTGKVPFAGSFLEAMWNRQTGEVNTAAIEDAAIESLSKARSAANLNSLECDIGVRDWLRTELSKGNDLDTVLQHMQEACPSYMNVAGFSTQRLMARSITDEISRWEGGLDSSYTHVAAVVAPTTGRLELGCVLVVGRRMQLFSPEALLKNPSGKFFSICTHCGAGHSCEIARKSESVTLMCPTCHRVYAMLAGDTQGHLHYVNEYLTGYQPPAHFPKNLSQLEEMLRIWREVSHTCHYLADPTNPDPTATDDPTDSWQFAQETQILQTGDCEDSSIMLADWLLARGFEARVAVGRYAERGGHAWVIVRLNGKEYLLESTIAEPDITHEPLVTEIGSRYVPEITFDHDAIYVRQKPRDAFDGDFWSDKKWIRIPGRKRPGKPQPIAMTDVLRSLNASW